jgi:hypothetical protein
VLRYDGGVTKRNLTEAEVEFNAQREALISKVTAQYVADAPFVFTTRVQTTAMLSRIRLFEMIREMPGAVIECGVFRGNSLMLV